MQGPEDEGWYDRVSHLVGPRKTIPQHGQDAFAVGRGR
jgi:hypothetical protein